mgnify:CR=1 FL=1
MKKLMHGLVIACGVAITPALAQTATYACQYVKSGGLIWEDSEWRPTLFHLDSPFFLKTENGSITLESVAEVFGGIGRPTPEALMCTKAIGTQSNQSCIYGLGQALSFSTTTLSGTIANLFAGTQPQDDAFKDSLSVMPFVCTKV